LPTWGFNLFLNLIRTRTSRTVEEEEAEEEVAINIRTGEDGEDRRITEGIHFTAATIVTNFRCPHLRLHLEGSMEIIRARLRHIINKLRSNIKIITPTSSSRYLRISAAVPTTTET